MLSWSYICALWFAQLLCLICARRDDLVRRATDSSSLATAAPTPISVSPSQQWDGSDGPWSSFNIRIGSPEQDIRVLVSTTSQQTWAVLPEGCPRGDVSCSVGRGGIFDNRTSSTFNRIGPGYFGLGVGRNLNLSANGFFGNDTVGLGIQGSGGPSLKDQVIGGIADERYYVGMLGLNHTPIRFPNLDGSRATYLSSLKEQNFIPSKSFGYTAGAQYRLKEVFASLTLGGYDQSRFTPNQMTFSFPTDDPRNLRVGLQSINFTTPEGVNTALLPSGILTVIDSTFSQIWLPVESCQAFEKAFGLKYDEEANLYPVDNALHDALVAQNASITFTLGQTSSGGKTIDIELPYNSFALRAKPPFVKNSTRYFPIRRAKNDTQYTLGRAFLQEAYLIVDWERESFSLSQCLFKDNNPPRLLAIEPASMTPAGERSGDNVRSNRGKLAGIIVGVVLAVLIGIVSLLCCLRQRKRHRAGRIPPSENEPTEKGQLGNEGNEFNADNDHAVYELNGVGKPQRQRGTESQPTSPPLADKSPIFSGERPGVGELSNDQPSRGLSPSEPLLGSRYEMPGSETAPVELPGEGLKELHGSELQPGSLDISSAPSRSVNQPLAADSIGTSTAALHTPPAEASSQSWRLGRRLLARSSAHGSPPSPFSSASHEDMRASQGIELSGPISPMREGDNPIGQAKPSSVPRGTPPI